MQFGIPHIATLAMVILAACDRKAPDHPDHVRPLDPWAFRSVLDRQPRMLTLALDSSCYVAYDLSHCILYKAWKGGITFEGAAYTDKKNVQPTSWGKSYFSDSLHTFRWAATVNGQPRPVTVISKGYRFRNNQITLLYELRGSGMDTIRIQETPEFLRGTDDRIGLERIFSTSGIPDGMTVSLQSPDSTFSLEPNKTVWVVKYFEAFPPQFPPKQEAEYDHRGRYFMEKSDCLTCHEPDKKTVGPSFQQIAAKYPNEKTAIQYLMRKIQEGGAGVWGSTAMNAHPKLSEKELRTMLSYVFSLKPKDEKTAPSVPVRANKMENVKPGFGAPLESLHPSYDVQTLHSKDFRPRVGGLAFYPDGRMLVTTWDTSGSVYLLDGVETGDTSKISVKRIASGLAEPLGIEVVDGEIYVMQKQELTHLIDDDGDGVIDTYDAICNQWGVTADFHEFGFGLVYKDGYFYATLSMAMRLMSGEKQQPDRGRTIKIARDGTYTWVNFGLRTPNGIGVGIDNEIFLTDNQGEWTPGNKLIHVQQGAYHGMRWGLPDSLAQSTPVVPPAVWIPEDEIGNSPSEPVLMQDGPYKGQMLHGDVTHGGIKRDFLEVVDGEYQGAVFRFTQGLAAGVNRLRWGPDGALYAGEVGMVGGWSWKGNQYGLQRLKYNGRPTFEMLAIRARPGGFEIEFTEPLVDATLRPSDFIIRQWWYLPTENYGGPKMDLEDLKVTHLTISDDKQKILLEIQGLKPGHVVYFRIPDDLQSVGGQPLWSSESWYTLNHIPH